MSTVLFLSLRVLHVLLAATWIGATVFMTFLLMPVLEASGAAGGQITVSLNRKALPAFFGAVGGITALTGIYLFWRFTGGFDPAVSRTNAGMAYGIGGAAGLLAVILGGAVVGRNAKKAADLIEKAARMSDAQKAPILQQIDAVNQRVKSFGLVVLALQAIALILMSIAHYI